MTNSEQNEVMELEGYRRPTYNKLVHSAMMHSTITDVIQKLTVNECVDHINTSMTCCGEFSDSKM